MPFQDPFLDLFILATDPKTATAGIEIVFILSILAYFMLTSTMILYDFGVFRYIPVYSGNKMVFRLF